MIPLFGITLSMTGLPSCSGLVPCSDGLSPLGGKMAASSWSLISLVQAHMGKHASLVQRSP